MLRAIWRRVAIPRMGPGPVDEFGRYSMNVPTGETMAVYKAHCPKCNSLCNRRDAVWYCPACQTYYDGAEEE